MKKWFVRLPPHRQHEFFMELVELERYNPGPYNLVLVLFIVVAVLLGVSRWGLFFLLVFIAWNLVYNVGRLAMLYKIKRLL